MILDSSDDGFNYGGIDYGFPRNMRQKYEDNEYEDTTFRPKLGRSEELTFEELMVCVEMDRHAEKMQEWRKKHGRRGTRMSHLNDIINYMYPKAWGPVRAKRARIQQREFAKEMERRNDDDEEKKWLRLNEVFGNGQ